MQRSLGRMSISRLASLRGGLSWQEPVFGIVDRSLKVYT